jgi:PEP-CTERM motif
MSTCLKLTLLVTLWLFAHGASAMTTFTYTWTNITCGIIAADGSRAEESCSGPSFAAMVEPGQSVFVSASLSYTYSDDGLPLEQPGFFQTDAFGHGRSVDHEAAVIFMTSNLCLSRLCLLTGGRPDLLDTFSGPTGLIFGENAVPDEASGAVGFFASAGVPSTQLSGGTRFAFFHASVTTFSGVPAIPEPGTYALMLAGLALLGVVALRRGRA